jgi:hypothetical protein
MLLTEGTANLLRSWDGGLSDRNRMVLLTEQPIGYFFFRQP